MKPRNYCVGNRSEKVDAHRFLVEHAGPKEYSPATSIANRFNEIHGFKKRANFVRAKDSGEAK